MIGRTVSHYLLTEKIGAGGMGVVYKARDTILDRTVALKFLPADSALDEERRRQFLKEAQLAASVSDSHIIQVYELGHEGDLDFIAMEYVEGRPLSELLQGRPLTPDRVAEWGGQLSQGLARAHSKGLVHRDIKPGNIMITPEDDVKLVDFGLAALISASSGAPSCSPTSPTRPASGRTTAAGTLLYMSPEQVRGEQLDTRSDVFSLCSVLYEMTTGRLPFAGGHPAETMRQILQSQPVPVNQLVPEVPIDLQRIIEKGLSKSPSDRYQTVDEIAIDLKRLRRELESGSALSFGHLHPARKSRRRVRMLSAIGPVVFLLGFLL